MGIVKKRLASLNASAIMSASYAQERPKDAQDSHALVPYSASEAAISLASASAAAASSSATVVVPKNSKTTPEKKSKTPTAASLLAASEKNKKEKEITVPA